MTITLDTNPPPEDRQAINDRLNAYNREHSPTKGVFEMYNLSLRDEDGVCRGGLGGVFYGHWLFIEMLFIDAELRGQDWGSQLLARAEADARARDTVGIWLDTFDFHAPSFYEKNGYEVFGELPDYPRGHKRFFFCKRLTSSPIASE